MFLAVLLIAVFLASEVSTFSFTYYCLIPHHRVVLLLLTGGYLIGKAGVQYMQWGLS